MKNSFVLGLIAVGMLLAYCPQMVFSQDESSPQSLRGDRPITEFSEVVEWKRVPAEWSNISKDAFEYFPNRNKNILIKHSIDGYRINQNVIKCLSCHGTILCEMDSKTDQHFKSNSDCNDYDKFQDSIDGRYSSCTLCHVEQADAEPPRVNDFQSIE